MAKGRWGKGGMAGPFYEHREGDGFVSRVREPTTGCQQVSDRTTKSARLVGVGLEHLSAGKSFVC